MRDRVVGHPDQESEEGDPPKSGGKVGAHSAEEVDEMARQERGFTAEPEVIFGGKHHESGI